MIKKIVSIVFVIFVIVMVVVPTYAMSIGDTNSKFNALAYPSFVVDLKHNGYIITDETVINGYFPITQNIDDYFTLSFDGYNISVLRSVQYAAHLVGFDHIQTTYSIDNSPFDLSFDGSLRVITNGIYLYDSYEGPYTRFSNPYIYLQTYSNVRAYVTLKGIGYDGTVVTGSRIEIFGERDSSDSMLLQFYLGDVFRGINNDYHSLYCSMFAIEFESSLVSTFDSISIGSPLTTTDFKLQIFEDMANEANDIGYSSGYSKGYSDGDSTTVTGVFNGILDGFTQIFNTKLFGEFSLGSFVYIGLAALLVGVVLRFFAGG